VPGAISGADEVQPRAEVGGRSAIGHRPVRIRTVAFRENLIRRGIKHDERVIVIHVPSMSQAYAGRPEPKVVVCRGHSTLAAEGPERSTEIATWGPSPLTDPGRSASEACALLPTRRRFLERTSTSAHPYHQETSAFWLPQSRTPEAAGWDAE
jgi:hypothetical protein